MDYKLKDCFYSHPERMAIFVGDLIDRGLNQRATVRIVRNMVEAGAAHAILGNHEFNAIGFHFKDPANNSRWLRERSKKNIAQHRMFIDDYKTSGSKREMESDLEWFRTLPLWIELEGLRVVHACWDQKAINLVADPHAILITDNLVHWRVAGSLS